jgi:hypothetical protein
VRAGAGGSLSGAAANWREQVQSWIQVVSQMSFPTRICQIILFISNSEGHVDESVEKLNSAKRLKTRVDHARIRALIFVYYYTW